MKQSRLKSKVVWGTLATLVLFLLKNYGLLEPIGLTSESYKELTTLLLTTLIAFGVLNNPTDKDKW